jgi:hypothetical protein
LGLAQAVKGDDESPAAGLRGAFFRWRREP